MKGLNCEETGSMRHEKMVGCGLYCNNNSKLFHEPIAEFGCA